ncbi:hypothetical protein [Aquabacterium sp.]|uniref:hypothetical protein n=1 Tax=Aquabacterium sp. TaxID=1872578 RepID=UPI00248A55AE|nr:hypothetical protein [Aquabacterium sp.]MDI1261506.1 hypothetical protein [Aquabacterium sp.]
MLISSQASAWSVVAALLGAAMMLSAPVQAEPVAADPTDPQATVPPVVYQSPLAGVRPLSDPAVSDWRQAHQTVLSRGGWRGYAREAAMPPERAASSPPGASPKPDPHAGHSHSNK